MSKSSGKIDRTVVKVFINTVAGACLVVSSPALAAPPASSAPTLAIPTNPATPTAATTTSSSPSDAALKEMRNQDRCERASESIRQSRNKISEACRKAGMSGSGNCAEKADSCSKESGEESFDTMAAFATVLGVPAYAATGIGSACPQMNGRDYFTEKDKILKDIQETEKELAELNDDKAKIQDDYNKEMQDLQETLTKAQEDLKKKNLDIEQKDRERIAEFNSSQNQAKEELRKKGSEILRLRGNLIQSQRDKALKLIAMTDASGKRACMKAVTEAKKSYESVSAGTSSNHIAQAKQKKKELINIYNDCMEAFDQQRLALNESKKQEQDELNKQITDLQSSVDEIQNSLNLAASQLEEMKQAAAKEKSDALQSVIDLGTMSQQKMQAAYAKMQENLKTLATKSSSLQAALNRANQSLLTLGPAPKSRSSEYSPSDASSEINSEQENIESQKSILTSLQCPGDPTGTAKKGRTSNRHTR